MLKALEQEKGDPMRTLIRRTLYFAVACATIALLSPSFTQACGDKLVVLGGGVPFSRIHKSRHPGKVVLFVNPNSQLRAANEEFRLGAALSLAGHTVQIVESRAALDRTLAETRPDLVLMDWSEALSLSADLARSPSSPAILHVLYKPTPTELAAAQEQTHCVAEAAKRKGRHVMRTVEQMMETRDNGLPVTCDEPPVKGKS
jgi:CheY-like chemotaxis protein